MARVEFDIDSELPPQRIIDALTDFTERRPEIWPGLSAKEYEVYEVGDKAAVVREGNGGQIWAKERYDWSEPGVVRWEVLESGFCEPGSFVQAEIKPKGTGSEVHVTWQRVPTTFAARLIMGLIVMTRGAPVKGSLKKGFDRIAKLPG
ncbi:MAG: SRPBCC family protein [Actinomycetota bacterium]